MPAFFIEDFADIGQVLERVLAVQAARRNVTAAQIACTALEIKAMQGYPVCSGSIAAPEALAATLVSAAVAKHS